MARTLVTLAAVAALAAAAAASTGGSATKGCTPSGVSYRNLAAARDIGFRGGNPPWVSSGGVVGFLFYYGAPPFDGMHSARAYVTTDGEVGKAAHTKILWWFRRTAPVGLGVAIDGTRLDKPGTFHDSYGGPAAGSYRTGSAGASFPSYLVVPDPGCWRVTVSSGRARATFFFGVFRVSG